MHVETWDGKAISAPGAFAKVTMAAYHGQLCVTPSASKSQLWRIIDKSPAHLWDAHYLNPEREEQDESRALTFGRAAHHLLLSEDDFHGHFVIRPDDYPEGAIYPDMIGATKPWSGNSKWCKNWLADQAIKGLEVLKPEELETVRRMAGGLNAHPMVRAGILNGLIETTLVARDPETGVWLKVRPDAIPTDGGDFSDLKSIADISDEGIERAIGDTGIPMQGAMVRRVCTLLGIEFTSFSLIFSEKTSPYCVRVKTLTEGDLELGDKLVTTALKVYARCLDRMIWPGPGGDQVDAEYAQMSPWKRGQLERRAEKLEKEMLL